MTEERCITVASRIADTGWVSQQFCCVLDSNFLTQVTKAILREEEDYVVDCLRRDGMIYHNKRGVAAF